MFAPAPYYYEDGSESDDFGIFYNHPENPAWAWDDAELTEQEATAICAHLNAMGWALPDDIQAIENFIAAARAA